jgi:hypothetical protein
LEQRAEVRVLGAVGVEEVVPVREDALLGSKPVAEQRPGERLREGSLPCGQPPARGEECAPVGLHSGLRQANLALERQLRLGVERAKRRRRGRNDVGPEHGLRRRRLRKLENKDGRGEEGDRGSSDNERGATREPSRREEDERAEQGAEEGAA